MTSLLASNWSRRRTLPRSSAIAINVVEVEAGHLDLSRRAFPLRRRAAGGRFDCGRDMRRKCHQATAATTTSNAIIAARNARSGSITRPREPSELAGSAQLSDRMIYNRLYIPATIFGSTPLDAFDGSAARRSHDSTPPRSRSGSDPLGLHARRHAAATPRGRRRWVEPGDKPFVRKKPSSLARVFTSVIAAHRRLGLFSRAGGSGLTSMFKVFSETVAGPVLPSQHDTPEEALQKAAERMARLHVNVQIVDPTGRRLAPTDLARELDASRPDPMPSILRYRLPPDTQPRRCRSHRSRCHSGVCSRLHNNQRA